MRTTLGVLGVLSALAAVAVRATNNGLAKTPPMVRADGCGACCVLH
jgi:hypothetical protein